MATGPQGPLQLQLLAKRALALGAGRSADAPWARSHLLVIRELSRKQRRDLRRRPAQRELGGHACAKAPARVQLARLGMGRIALGPHLRRIGAMGPIAPPVARGLPARGRAREPDAARDLLVGAARCRAARDGEPLREFEPCGLRACSVPFATMEPPPHPTRREIPSEKHHLLMVSWLALTRPWTSRRAAPCLASCTASYRALLSHFILGHLPSSDGAMTA